MRCCYENAKYPAKIHEQLTYTFKFLHNSL